MLPKYYHHKIILMLLFSLTISCKIRQNTNYQTKEEDKRSSNL